MQQVEDHTACSIWLSVLAELVIPAESCDGPDPDGIASYLCAMLETPRGQILPMLIQQLKAGLAEFDEADFLDLSSAERQARLEQLVDQADPPVRQAWSMFIEFCVEAWLSDPARGGNRRERGWRRVGMSGPRLPEQA